MFTRDPTLIENCAKYQFIDYHYSCAECNSDPTTLVLNTQTKLCENLTTGFANCLEYDSVCNKCKSGFVRKINGSVFDCVNNITVIDKCILYKADDTCNTCEDHYELINNVCELKVKNCKNFDNSDKCIECDTGYINIKD